jgi:IS5 family transposase
LYALLFLSLVARVPTIPIRWYLGYDLHEPLPDHSSLTKIRERYGLGVFRRFFDTIVQKCIEVGLVEGEELYFDATKVRANACLDSMTPRFAVGAHLTALFADQSHKADVNEPPLSRLPTPSDEIARERLAAENSARHDWIAEEGRQERDTNSGSYRRVADYQVSRSDPDSALMRSGEGLRFGYHTHYAVDGGKARVILQALVTPAEVMENQPMLDLLWRSRFRWRIHPHQVTGDATYGTIENIVPVENAGLRAYFPLRDYEARSPYFGKSRFTYDPNRDLYTCPQGKPLERIGAIYKDQVIRYQADATTCNACPVKERCTPSSSGRQVRRSFHEGYLDRVRGYHGTKDYRRAIGKRKVWVEPLFAEAKDWHGLHRFRLRGLKRVNMEALLVATGQNLKRLLSGSWGRRPWPLGAAGWHPTPL